MPQTLATFPNPFCKQGDRLSATNLNALADGVRRINQIPDSYISSVMVLQAGRRGGGSGGSIENVLALGEVVLDPADPDGGSVGRAVLLDENDLTPVDIEGNPLITSIYDSGYDEYYLLTNSIPFKCDQRYAGCAIGIRVRLYSSGPIIPGQEVWGEGDIPSKVWGYCADVADYLYWLDGAGPRTSLAIPDSTGESGEVTGAGSIQWLGGLCPPPPESS